MSGGVEARVGASMRGARLMATDAIHRIPHYGALPYDPTRSTIPLLVLSAWPTAPLLWLPFHALLASLWRVGQRLRARPCAGGASGAADHGMQCACAMAIIWSAVVLPMNAPTQHLPTGGADAPCHTRDPRTQQAEPDPILNAAPDHTPWTRRRRFGKGRLLSVARGSTHPFGMITKVVMWRASDVD